MSDALLHALYDSDPLAGGWHDLAAPLAASIGGHSLLCHFVASGGGGSAAGGGEANAANAGANAGAKAGAKAGASVILAATENITPGRLATYAEHYFRRDPWRQLGHQAGSGVAGIGSAFLPDQRLAASAFYQDWCRPLDIGRLAGVMIDTPEGTLVLGVHRRLNEREFTADQARQTGNLARHMMRAISIRQRLAGPALPSTSLEGASTVSVLVDRGLRILAVSPEAEMAEAEMAAAEMAAAGARFFTAGTGVFALADAPSQQRFIAAWARMHAQATALPWRMPLRGSGGAVADLHVLPLPAIGPAAAAIVLAPMRQEPAAMAGGSGDQPAAVAAAMARATLHYGLTAAQARLAGGLAEGLSLRGCAERQAISYETARTHLRQIFAKTSTTRQSALIRALLAPAPAEGMAAD